MEISMTCPVCSFEEQKVFTVRLKQQNDCVYTVNCPKGHEFKINILYHPFQKLFEIAVYAIADGYLREAVGSFAASYERFMELFIRVVCKKRGLDAGKLDQTWKLMSRLSERQLGAFIFTHLMEFEEQPKTLREPAIKLRNRVIHQGYIPTENEAIEYGNDVMDCITSVLERVIKSSDHQKVLIGAINEYGDFSCEGPRVTYLPYHMIGTNRTLNDPKKSVEDHVAIIRNQRKQS